ncbi:MAG: FAD-binding oxidoreductase [Pseudomonadota bacterium]
MADISCDIVVVGAGVLGLCVAVELTARGHDVRVVDPGGPNASSVAAGMIAPAFESLLDGADDRRAALLRDAAALWPSLADRIGVALDTTPAEWRGGDGEDVATRLRALGFAAERVGEAVRARDDVKIDVGGGLAGLVAALDTPVIVAEAMALERRATGWRVETTAGAIEARRLVIATGTAGSLPGAPKEVAALINRIEPVAGQIGRTKHTMSAGVLRGADGYVVGAGDHVLIGATMVSGSRDASPDPVASTRLVAAAEGLLGEAVSEPVAWSGGVRGATADGLPMAGPTSAPGLHLALAPRRNGWLVGPLVGRIVADGIEGRPRGPHAAAFDPLRFSPLEA